MKKTNYILLLIAALGLLSCKPELTPAEMSLGEVDPSSFVSIGTELSAGYMDDALYAEGQTNSFPAIISAQFQLIQSSAFVQPLMNQFSDGVSPEGNAKLILGYKTDCKSVTSLSPVRFAAQGDISGLITSVYSSLGPFNNFSVPFLSTLKVNTSGYGNSSLGTGNFNPYFSRIASNEINSSVLQDALAKNPTFFTLNLGDYDIMAYAKSGGTDSPIPPVNGAAGVGFDGSLNEVISSLTANGAKGAISNIPEILDLPFFTTIPYDGLDLDAANASTLNSVFNPLGISFQIGKNGFAIADASEPFGVRKMLPGELILLSVPLDSIKCYGMGSIVPIPDKYILTLDEINEIETKIQEYNQIIHQAAISNSLAYVNLKSLYQSLNTGIIYNGVSMNLKFVTGGTVSLDGKTLNPIGQAMVANTFIYSINEKYNAHIPLADVTKFRGVKFP